MKIIQSPNQEIPFYDELTLFLAGSITGARNWQDDMVELLKKENLTIINPRRLDFDVNDPSMSKDQITWEFDHLHSCKQISFWFSDETLAPITLLELGAALERLMAVDYSGFWPLEKIFIGIHPLYKRKFDIEIQTNLILERCLNQKIAIVYSIEDLVKQIKDYNNKE
jgi:hypothetical protein